jgi:3-oxoacyl-[acyl-carrier protein] reductase
MTNSLALVTGGARGLGYAIAKHLNDAGFSVIIGDIEGADAAAQSIGGTARSIVLDIGDPVSIKSAAQEIGSLAVLVNNAAITRMTSIWDMSAQEFDEVITTNLRGTFLMLQAFTPAMRAAGTGRIINLGSIAGQTGGNGTGAHYAASKAGIAVLTKIFARELAASGVTVNCVAPGPLDSPLVRSAPSELVERLKTTIPVGHLGDMDEVASLVTWLAGPAAASVTGTTFDVNGGLFMR